MKSIVNTQFEISTDHRRWARRAKQKYGRTVAYWLDLLAKQQGCCAFSGVRMLFDSESGTAQAGGAGRAPSLRCS